MQLVLMRKWYSDKTTIGELYLNNEFFCYTLEDQHREYGAAKVYGQTCISDGTYDVVLTHSPKYKRTMPRLLNVPNFEGILIHWGNKAEDTHGCILVGASKSADWISGSKDTFNKLYSLLEAAKASGESISITIENCANEL